MSTNHDRFESQLTGEEYVQIFGAAEVDGYEPDEDDPAWPSRSGQAD